MWIIWYKPGSQYELKRSWVWCQNTKTLPGQDMITLETGRRKQKDYNAPLVVPCSFIVQSHTLPPFTSAGLCVGLCPFFRTAWDSGLDGDSSSRVQSNSLPLTLKQVIRPKQACHFILSQIFTFTLHFQIFKNLKLQ